MTANAAPANVARYGDAPTMSCTNSGTTGESPSAVTCVSASTTKSGASSGCRKISSNWRRLDGNFSSVRGFRSKSSCTKIAPTTAASATPAALQKYTAR